MSNYLTIAFLGLNTHFDRERNGDLRLPRAWRVVVPGFYGSTQWGNETLPAHRPHIDFGGPVAIDLPERHEGGYWLERVTITLLQTAQASIPRDPMLCAPHLKAIWPAMEIDPNVVTGGASPAAAYIDFDGGTMSQINHRGSVAVEVTFDHGEATVATLEVMHWPDGPSKTIEISLPRVITIENTGGDKDREDDIVLNLFMAMTPPPADLPLLAVIRALTERCVGGGSPSPADLGVGCSNSQFP